MSVIRHIIDLATPNPLPPGLGYLSDNLLAKLKNG